MTELVPMVRSRSGNGCGQQVTLGFEFSHVEGCVCLRGGRSKERSVSELMQRFSETTSITRSKDVGRLAL